MLDSPFIDMLHTNIVPSEAQCDEIRAYIDAHLALLSPMRRVPDDILRSIFVAVRDLQLGPPTFATKYAPMIFLHICQRWREVALTTPHLWTAIPVPFLVANRKFRAVKSRIVSSLERSGIVPLDLLVSLGGDGSHSSEPLSLLLSVSQRWKTLDLRLSDTIDTAALSELTPIDVPQLQQVDITLFRRRLPAGAGHNIQLNLLTSGALRSFSFQGVYEFLPLRVSWTTLVHLKLNLSDTAFPPTPSTIIFPFRFLAECKLLQTLEIRLRGYFDPLVRGQTILLPNLTKVVLDTVSRRGSRGRQVFANRHIFVCLHTPALRSLELIRRRSDHLSGDFFRPIFWITDLRIPLFKTAELITTLDGLPLLEKLRLMIEPRAGGYLPASATEVDKPFLALLIPTTSGSKSPTPRCRHLRVLHLESIQKLADALVVEFLQARTVHAAAHGVARLVRFTCVFTRPPRLSIEEELKDAVAEGLELNLFYRTV
ncbi:hypothetical protein C8F01DRAFT_1045892 [Mycena amicta]|nr:hypothetical protein C8F01DRAFT_1045892 [Mycena amicta]